MWRTRNKTERLVAACRDFGGRPRKILVTPTDDRRVAVMLPAGEVAVLRPSQVGQLRAALRDVVLAMDDAATREAQASAARGGRR